MGMNAMEVAEALSSEHSPLPDESLFKKELVNLSSGACAKLDDLDKTAYPMQELYDHLDKIGARTIMLMLEANFAKNLDELINPPNLPELGSALRELRNLRATRALSQPRTIAPAADGAGT